MGKIGVCNIFENVSHFIWAQIKNANEFDKAKALATLICLPFDMLFEKTTFRVFYPRPFVFITIFRLCLFHVYSFDCLESFLQNMGKIEVCNIFENVSVCHTSTDLLLVKLFNEFEKLRLLETML